MNQMIYANDNDINDIWHSENLGSIVMTENLPCTFSNYSPAKYSKQK